MRFSTAELEFIRKELSIQANENEERTEVLEQIWEEACEIEIEESDRLEVLTPRGEMAVSLVTKLGRNE